MLGYTNELKLLNYRKCKSIDNKWNQNCDKMILEWRLFKLGLWNKTYEKGSRPKNWK